MRAAHVPDDALTSASVPAPDAALDELVRFGHGYHAYRVAGSLPRVARIALDLHDRWANDHDGDARATLDEPLPQLRVALFHTVRALEHDPAGAIEHDPAGALEHDPAGALEHDPAGTPTQDAAGAPTHDSKRALTHDSKRALTHDTHRALTHDTHRALTHDTHRALTHDTDSALTHDTDPALGRPPTTDAERWIRVLVRSIGAALAERAGR